MLDFMMVSTRMNKKGGVEIYPKFIIKNKSQDLLIKGNDFYAIWVEDRGLWSTDEDDAIQLIDRELKNYRDEHYKNTEVSPKVLYLWDAESGMIDTWHKYCQKQLRNNFHVLDQTLIFSNSETNKTDYASKRLSYPLEEGSIAAYDKLISTLYTEEERHKLEWAIGAIVTGDAKHIQKFMVLYGEAGAGKSTILNIIQKLFAGYDTVFDAKALGSASSQFALEPFRNNPLVGVQHDGDLSKLEDNTRLNSLVSHERMSVNEKFTKAYDNTFNAFLFMGTNKPVKITDAKSGLMRRLIDVSPSGKKLGVREYKQVVKQIDFELGAIAYHCKEVYLSDPGHYDDYMPLSMMGASNDFYNFVIDSYHVFVREDGTTLKAAWEMYRTYCEEAKVPYPLSQRSFKEELKNYFREYNDRFSFEDGSRVRSYYTGFRTDKFESGSKKKKQEEAPKQNLIKFEAIESIFDKERADCPAQYSTSLETPAKKWDEVKKTLADIDTSKVHYVMLPENHIVIDFDIRGKDGSKSLERNIEEASKWPATYAELSKSGAGVHLHYIYTGDVNQLSQVYDDQIEVKKFTGKSSLRRKLTKCNNLPIANISSGLPLKGEKKMVNFDAIKSEKGLRTMIKRNLNKEVHASTKCSIDFINKILNDAYESDLGYDVSDMYDSIFSFAANSTNQADYCMKIVDDMHFKSEDPSLPDIDDNASLVFFDVEVFPNLLLVNWKIQGEGKPVVRMINPAPTEVEDLLHFNLVGFNNRKYDNHILYARLMGYSNEQIYELSQKLVSKDKKISMDAMFGEAFNLSYTDVLDFCTEKKSLKKWEIDLGLHHQELGLPWDQPVPENMWTKVAEYCDNDVIATEAVFNARQGDFMARKIQVELVNIMHGISNVSVNDTTNTLSKRIIFGNNRKPQSQFNWRNLAEPVGSDRYEEYRRLFGDDYKFRVFDDEGLPLYRDYVPGEVLPKGYSILPFFKGYTYSFGKSIYMGMEVGEGGRVDAEPGMYINVWDGDIASQHPHSIIFEVLFGPEFTKRFEEIVAARVAIKRKDFETAAKLLNGALKPYLNEEYAADLAQALKIVINSIYGLTSAAFENEFRDPRNIDNIVAKRGNLFMTLLKSEVKKRGYSVAHIKTDSIKIPNMTQEIMDFVTKFGAEYGYTFETEAVFKKFCLVNDAVYIAKLDNGEWTATGKQFAVPYVFKTLFTKEEIVFDDLCETFAVQTALYLDRNENLPDVSVYEKELDNRYFNRNKTSKSKPKKLNPEFDGVTDEELRELAAKGHDYRFVGKVGSFCPIKPGCNGGELLRAGVDKEGNPKYASATGAKDYLWLEAELVRTLGKEDDVDRSYYRKLVDDAVEAISQYGDFEQFVSDDILDDTLMVETISPADLPWIMPCGDEDISFCSNCPNFRNDDFHIDCKLGYDISNVITNKQLIKESTH